MKLKNLFTMSVVSSAILLVPTPTEAAYILNPEIRTATPSLKIASQIGMLQYINENEALKKSEDKSAILVMSFGTTYKENRVKTIEATVQDIQSAHPNVKVVTAFTSHIIIDRIEKNEGITYPTPEQALEKLKADGYSRIALVSLDIIPGMEYEYTKAIFNIYKNKFTAMTLSTSLLYWQGQETQADDFTDFITAIFKQVQKPIKKAAVLLMAHGTPQPANAYYSVLQAKLENLGYRNVFVYTVEGWPSLQTVIPKLKSEKINTVLLVPLMLVAGDHANNDMASDAEDSHKILLTNEGFKVSVDLRGLGENAAIRELYVKRANDAWNALNEN